MKCGLLGSVPVERPNPPQTVFSLPPANNNNFAQRQTSRFPEPEFGGFRPVKRQTTSSRRSDRRKSRSSGGGGGNRRNRPAAQKSAKKSPVKHQTSQNWRRAFGRSSSRRPHQRAQEKSDIFVYDDEYSDLDNDILDYYYYYEYLD